MAWHSGKPADGDFLSVSVRHIRENFAELEPLQPHVAELVDLTTLRPHIGELVDLTTLRPHIGELVDLTTLHPHVAALLDSRIVEMGSNSNGTYVRWENGLQVCWHVATMARDDNNNYPSRLRYNWTFPASFVAGVIAVGGSVSNVNQNWAVNSNVERRLAGPVMPDMVFEDGTFFVSWRIDGANWSSGQAVQNCQFWAIGRWK